MHTALKERQVGGTTASVGIVQELVHKTNFQGGNCPTGSEPTSEKMTPCDGMIKGDTIMYLLVEGGKMLKYRYENNYR